MFPRFLFVQINVPVGTIGGCERLLRNKKREKKKEKKGKRIDQGEKSALKEKRKFVLQAEWTTARGQWSQRHLLPSFCVFIEKGFR